MSKEELIDWDKVNMVCPVCYGQKSTSTWHCFYGYVKPGPCPYCKGTRTKPLVDEDVYLHSPDVDTILPCHSITKGN